MGVEHETCEQFEFVRADLLYCPIALEVSSTFQLNHRCRLFMEIDYLCSPDGSEQRYHLLSDATPCADCVQQIRYPQEGTRLQ